MQPPPPVTTCDHVYDVIIVGAGVAGLAAARELLASGVENFIVLEASERAGGRVFTFLPPPAAAAAADAANDDLVEIGATWLHGSQNPLCLYADEAGLLAGGVASAEEDWYVAGKQGPLWLRPGGRIVAEATVARTMQTCEAIFGDACDGSSGGNPDALTHSSSSVRFLALSRWRKRGSSGLQQPQEGEGEEQGPVHSGMTGDEAALMEMRHMGECAFTGASSLSALSPSSLSEYAYFDEQNMPPPGGFRRVLQSLWGAGAEGRTAFRHLVSRVDYTRPDFVTISGTRTDCSKGADVSDAGGSIEFVFRGRAVLLTLSLGVLKAVVPQPRSESPITPSDRYDFFCPPLPAPKARAIHRMGFGRVEKVHLEWDEYWWRRARQPEAGGAAAPDRADAAARVGGAACEHAGVSPTAGFGLTFLWDAPLVQPESYTPNGRLLSAAGPPGADPSGAGAVQTLGAGLSPSSATPAHCPPPPFPGYAPWMAQVFGAYEDRNPAPLTRPRLTFWLLKKGGDATDPPPQPADDQFTPVGEGVHSAAGAGGDSALPHSVNGAAAHRQTASLPPLSHSRLRSPCRSCSRFHCGGCLSGTATPLAMASMGAGEGAADGDGLQPPAPLAAGDGLSDAELADALVLILRYFLGDSAECGSEVGADSGAAATALPTTVSSPLTLTVPPPTCIIRSRWGSHPCFRGSYSYIAQGSSPADICVLAAPVGRATSVHPPTGGQVFFAGEATHGQYFSTTHGAFASGIREAKAVVAGLQLRGSA